MDFSGWSADFVAAGGRYAFGIPGGGASLQLAESLEDSGGEFVVTGHEVTAALMAGGFVHAVGKPAMCVSVKGPGFANMTPGLLANTYEGYPCLAFTESYDEGDLNGRKHKWLDHQRLLKSFSCRPFFSQNTYAFDEAWRLANAEFPGPVAVNLSQVKSIYAEQRITNANSAGSIVAEIARAKRPLLIVGSLACRSEWGRRLERMRLPIFTTAAAKGVIDERLPHAAGVFTGAGTRLTLERALLPLADLVLCTGVRAGEILCSEIDHANVRKIDSASLMHLFPTDSKDIVYLQESAIEELIDALQDKAWGENEIVAARHRLVQEMRELGWSPLGVCEVVSATLSRGLHVLDTGNFTVIAEHFLTASEGQRIMGTPNSRYMGVGVGYALGAAFAQPESGAVLWIGDGGIRALFSELGLALQYNLKLLVLVMQDGYFGSVRGRVKDPQLREGILRLQGPGALPVAEGLGLQTAVVKNADQLVPLLKHWEKGTQSLLVTCVFDPAIYENAGNLLR